MDRWQWAVLALLGLQVVIQLSIYQRVHAMQRAQQQRDKTNAEPLRPMKG